MIKDTKQRLFEMMNRVSKMPINESSAGYLTKEEFLNALPRSQSLNEIDWEKEFGDTSHNCLRPDAIVKWLNEELKRLRHNRGAKQKDVIPSKHDKTPGSVPHTTIMSQGNIENIVDSTGDPNIDMFIKNIALTEPDTIFDQNSKMEHSDVGRPQITVNTGLPALVAIVYDIEHEQFHSVTTCPAAGTCQIGCYARDAFYRMNDELIMKLTRRINLLLNNPKRYEQRVYGELLSYAVRLPENYQLVIRWNDAGDFFTKKYLDIAKNVTKKLLDDGYNVKSYAYTKVADYVMELDSNEHFVINFSTDASQSEQDKIANWSGGTNVKMGHRVPAYSKEKIPFKHKVGTKTITTALWKHFFKRKGPHLIKGDNGLPIFEEGGEEGLKNYIMDTFGEKFHVDRNSLKFSWELPEKDEGGRKYNVIVMSTGDNDIAAQRQDVRMTFLLEH